MRGGGAAGPRAGRGDRDAGPAAPAGGRRTAPAVARVTGSISVGLGRWLVAQLDISLFYVVAYSDVNVLLGIPYGITIGVVAGILKFSPSLAARSAVSYPCWQR